MNETKNSNKKTSVISGLTKESKIILCVIGVLILTVAFMPLEAGNWKYIYNIVVFASFFPMANKLVKDWETNN